MDKKLDIPVWVLNVERDVERRLFMEQQLNELGIDFELFKAVDKKTLTQEELSLYSKQDAQKCMGRELSNGEIACALSHARMWERMIDEQLPDILILEDDIRIGRSLFDILANHHKFPADLELLNFSTFAAQKPIGDYITDIYRLSSHLTDALSACAYYLTRDGSSKLLEKVYPICWAADELMGRTSITNVRSYGIYPRVAVIGNDFESSIWRESETSPLRLTLGAGRWRTFLQTRKQSLRQIADIIQYGTVRY